LLLAAIFYLTLYATVVFSGGEDVDDYDYSLHSMLDASSHILSNTGLHTGINIPEYKKSHYWLFYSTLDRHV